MVGIAEDDALHAQIAHCVAGNRHITENRILVGSCRNSFLFSRTDAAPAEIFHDIVLNPDVFDNRFILLLRIDGQKNNAFGQRVDAQTMDMVVTDEDGGPGTWLITENMNAAVGLDLSRKNRCALDLETCLRIDDTWRNQGFKTGAENLQTLDPPAAFVVQEDHIAFRTGDDRPRAGAIVT